MPEKFVRRNAAEIAIIDRIGREESMTEAKSIFDRV